MEEEKKQPLTSSFIKKYKQILKLKIKTVKKEKIIDLVKNSQINMENKNKLTSSAASEKLPYIESKNVDVSQNKPNNIFSQTSSKFKQSDVYENKILNELKIDPSEIKVNNKEYKKYIDKVSSMSPKKNIAIIQDKFYKRLLNVNSNNLKLKKDKQEIMCLKKIENKPKKYHILTPNNSKNAMPEIVLKKSKKKETANNSDFIKLPILNKKIMSKYQQNSIINKSNKNIEESKKPKLYESSLNKPPKEPKIIITNKKSDIVMKKSKSALDVRGKHTYKIKKEEEKLPEKLHYSILSGNNGKLIEKCLLTRPNWEILSENEKSIYSNLIWTPLSCQINFNSHKDTYLSQLVNHFEGHYELTNKKNTFINLLRYCEFNEIDLFSFYPLTIILYFRYENLHTQINSFKKLYSDISTNQNINKRYSDYFTVNLSKQVGSVQKINIPKSNFIGKNLWLIKRVNLNRGRDIKVLSDLDSIVNELETSKNEKKYNHLILQKYIEDPFLYKGRKFDIRIWVLFTYLSNDNKYEVYVFKEGHLKACCDNFILDSNDLFVHLTNYSVQKYNKNFSKSEIGNEISFDTFQNELNKISGGFNFKRDAFPKIVKIIGYSANAVNKKLNHLDRKNCFEIFGYDFILDKYFQPFLLEINTNPGYEESSPLIEMLVPRMIDDAFRLTIDVIFKRNDENKNISKFKVDGYTDEENLWMKVKIKNWTTNVNNND